MDSVKISMTTYSDLIVIDPSQVINKNSKGLLLFLSEIVNGLTVAIDATDQADTYGIAIVPFDM